MKLRTMTEYELICLARREVARKIDEEQSKATENETLERLKMVRIYTLNAQLKELNTICQELVKRRG